ncbi:hypothetical protein KKF32_00490 [Patescibacteria group bacterium]|nr:hypothetical protein [Patescibacteria group bacterium]
MKKRRQTCRRKKQGSLKNFLFKSIDTEKVLNISTMMQFNLIAVGCVIVFNLLLLHLTMMGSPVYKQELITPTVKSLSQSTIVEASGEILQNTTRAFSLTNGPLLNTFEVVEYYGQGINHYLTSAISSTQRSLDLSLYTSLASTY